MEASSKRGPMPLACPYCRRPFAEEFVISLFSSWRSLKRKVFSGGRLGGRHPKGCACGRCEWSRDAT
jgi:hypothetical protein